MRGGSDGAQGGCLGKVLKEVVSKKVTSKQTPEGGEGGRAVQIREVQVQRPWGGVCHLLRWGKAVGSRSFYFGLAASRHLQDIEGPVTGKWQR